MPSCGSTMGMFSLCASSSMRASTRSRGGTRRSRYSCRASVTSTVLIATPQILVEQGLQRDDVLGHAIDSAAYHLVVEARRVHRLVKPGPAVVPGLQLSAWQVGLDLDHARAKEIERGLVLDSRCFEVQTNLQPTGPGVVPCLVVEGGFAEVDLHQAAATTYRVEVAHRSRQLPLEGFAQLSKEVRWREQHQR